MIWRVQDANNYYVARANALEDNVSLYYTEGGRRKTIRYVNAPVPASDTPAAGGTLQVKATELASGLSGQHRLVVAR